MDLAEGRRYFDGHVRALQKMVKAGDPWVFLCGAAVIDYLTRLAHGKKTGRKEYIDFVRKFMPSAYANFTYSNPKIDLPTQVYFILRNGLVHSFSLTPDEIGPGKGRERSIVLTHAGQHMSAYTESGYDACRLDAAGFVADIQHAVNELFNDALREENILKWLQAAPPVGVLSAPEADEEPC